MARQLLILTVTLCGLSYTTGVVWACDAHDNTPYVTSIGQSSGDRIYIDVVARGAVYDCAYEIQFLNGAGQNIGSGGGMGSCPQRTYRFGPFCGVDQASKNIASVRIIKTNGFPLEIISVSVSKVSDPDIKGDSSGTNPGDAQEVSISQTLYGALGAAGNDDPENAKYWNVHLEKGQKIQANGWATSDTVQYGATLYVEIQPAGGGPNSWSQLAGVAPYGTERFGPQGLFTASEAGTYRVRVRCARWRICKFAVHLSVVGRRCPPSYTCPCSQDQGAKHQPVELTDGRERSDFDPDLTVYNPLGPSVSFERSWREVLALQREGTPGLARGWTHSYDFYLNSWGNGDVQLNYPGGAMETIKGTLGANEVATGTLTATAGAPYRVSGVADPVLNEPGTPCCGTGSEAPNTHKWKSVDITWDDGTVMRFVPTKRRYTYRLDKVTAPTGQWLQFEYDDANTPFGFLTAIKNQAGTTLLSLTYNQGYLDVISDVYGRKVAYAWEQPAPMQEPVLTAVSQPFVGSITSAPTLHQLGYENYGSRPLLKQISEADPNGGSGFVTSTNVYDALARVSSTTDANGNTHFYDYNGTSATQTVITVKNSAGATVQRWSMIQNSQGFYAGRINESGQRWYVYYEDPNNPLRPTRWVDPMGRVSTAAYDAYGHVTRTTNARGVSQVATWNYSAWPMGRLTQLQTVTPTASLAPMTFTYQEPTGLMTSATGPHPSGSGTVTITASYDSYGNPTQITQPGHAYTPTRVTNFSYTQDGNYTQPMMVGRPIAVGDTLGAVSHMRYDVHGNLYSETDANGATTISLHDDYDRPIITQLPATGQTGGGHGEIRYTYAYRGGPVTRVQIYNEAGAPARTFHRYYGKTGELKNSFGNALGESYEYDALYRVKTFIDGAGYRTSYSYDANGRLSEATYPNGTAGSNSAYDRTIITAYDASGSPLQQVDGRGVVTNLVYNDPEGRLTNVQYPAATYENVGLSYDNFGRLSQRTDAAGRENYVYTVANTLQSQTTTYKKADYSDMPSWTQSYDYNADGSRSSMATPLGSLYYGYDAEGRLNGVSGLDGQATTWSYLANGWLSGQKLPVGVQTSYNFNPMGQVLAQSNARVNASGAQTELLSQWGSSTNSAQSQLYNASGQLARNVAATTATYNFGGTTNYNYDDRAQLGGETSTRGIGYNHAYAYDGAGNPTTWKGQTRTFNVNNQETTGGFFGYNGDGTPWKYLNRNLADSANPNGKSQVYSYNVRGQLQQANAVNTDGTTGAVAMQSLYRGDGKRAWKQGADSTNRTYFFYDGDLLLGSSSEDGTRAGITLWGADGVIGSQWRDAQGAVHSVYNLYDTQGNLAQMLDENGAVVGGANGSVALTAWGEAVPRANGTVSSIGGYGAKFGYVLDGETGFYLCTYRHYDPAAGRWISRDPIGYEGGPNLYGYTENDPVNWTDPLGLDGWDFAKGAGKAVAGIIVGGVVIVGIGILSPEIAFGVAVVGVGVGVYSIGASIYRQWTTYDPLTGRHYSPAELDEDAGGAVIGVFAFACGWQFRQPKPKGNNSLPQGEIILPRRGNLPATQIAPAGNGTPSRTGRLPHWHWARPHSHPKKAAKGESAPGQGIGRHRPYDVKPEDKSFWDRFF